MKTSAAIIIRATGWRCQAPKPEKPMTWLEVAACNPITRVRESIIQAIRQWVIELDAEAERINAAREAMPPPIDREATAIRLKPHRRPSPPASDERRSKRRQKPAAAADD